MSKLNIKIPSNPIFTYENVIADRINSTQQLKRLVYSCLLWEDSFYINSEDHSKLLVEAISHVDPETVKAIAIEARSVHNLRHVPLFICREMARLKTHRHLVASTLEVVIQRADELCEYLAIYWKTSTPKSEPLSMQSRRGLSRALVKFDEYQLSKYNRKSNYTLKDFLRIVHPKPPSVDKATLWKKILDDTLTTPDTWEVELSKSKDKRESWTRLLKENKLGGLALLKNLRNMSQAGVSRGLIYNSLDEMAYGRILPFRFIAAAKHNPELEAQIETVMLKATSTLEKLPGKTAILVDNSGSMYGTKVSSKSDLDRIDAACALAILAREICEDVSIIGFGTAAVLLPPRRGFALRDCIRSGPGGGTDIANAVNLAATTNYDRIIIFTDEQSSTEILKPLQGTKAYIVNVASYKNGLSYSTYLHINGFSESIIKFISDIESM